MLLQKRLLFLVLISASASAQSPEWSKNATWISPGFPEDTIMRPLPVFSKDFQVKKPILTATVYVTALGLYEGTINGNRIGDAYLTPGWTSYDKRIQYQQYDISRVLQSGQNNIKIAVAEGWYRGAFGHFLEKNNYGTDAGLLFNLVIKYSDGSQEEIVSDSTWQSSIGPIIYADIYNGEIYDARKSWPDWSGVKILDYSKELLVPTTSPPVTKMESLDPVKLITTPKGEQVIDFGQNLTGWVRVKAKGDNGDTIRISHAEVLDKAGNFYTGNLRQAKATDTYILNGGVEELLEPHFTWHGFRYIKIEGLTARPENFKAVAIYSSLDSSGSFSCSNPLLNQLQHNILWSLKGNFVDIPTDCPQRSERLGWTGDAQIFLKTAAFNYDVRNFFAKWLADLKADQRSDGSVPNVIPNLYRKMGNRPGVAGWGDAATIIPWNLYWIYSDTAILRNQYASMKAWVDYITRQSKGGLWTAGGYGDWLAPGDSTSLPFIDQCFWAHSTQLLLNAARVLGKTDDEHKCQELLKQIKTAFLDSYIGNDGRAVTHTQTAYVLALQFDMLPEALRLVAAKHLAALINVNNNHLSTGFLGTPYLLHVLSQFGYLDLAYKVLGQDSYPSWLYPVKMGATTIWEKWDGIKPDGSVQATSYNHYSYGAVGDWFYGVIAGIKPAAPGYKKIIISPQPGGGLTWAKASYNSPYGKIVSEWKIENRKIILSVEIPPGTSATVTMPGGQPIKVLPGRHTFIGDHIPLY